MHTVAASLTSWTIWVTIYFPVLSWLFIGQTRKKRHGSRQISHPILIKLFIYYANAVAVWLRDVKIWMTLTQHRPWQFSWMWPHHHLCQGGTWATAHGIASWFLTAMHPGDRHTFKLLTRPHVVWKTVKQRESYRVSEVLKDVLSHSNYGSNILHTWGIKCVFEDFRGSVEYRRLLCVLTGSKLRTSYGLYSWYSLSSLDTLYASSRNTAQPNNKAAFLKIATYKQVKTNTQTSGLWRCHQACLILTHSHKNCLEISYS